MNEYEKAQERFSAAARAYAIARAALEEADQEWKDAESDLLARESRPGIPLPEYRRDFKIAGG